MHLPHEFCQLLSPPGDDGRLKSALFLARRVAPCDAHVRFSQQWYYGPVVSNRSCAAIGAWLLAATVAACKGPCSPPPPCRLPKAAVANAESSQERGRGARWYA